MSRDDIIVPGRVSKDYNSVSHWWTLDDLTGAVFTNIDLFFGMGQGGTAGLNPAMDKHYRLENIGVVFKHISPQNPLVTVQLRRNESAASSASFSFTPTDRAGGFNKFNGIWSPITARPPGGTYNIHMVVAAPGVSFVQTTVVMSWRILSDNTS